MSGFPITACQSCHLDVLIYGELNENNELIQRCIECDTEIEAAQIRLESAIETEKLGYHLNLTTEKSIKKECQGGSCGVQQP